LIAASMMTGGRLGTRPLYAGGPTITIAGLELGGDGGSVSRRVRSFAIEALMSLAKPFAKVFSQNSHAGALPTVRAATDPAVRGGECYSPDGFMEQRGAPKRVESNSTPQRWA